MYTHKSTISQQMKRAALFQYRCLVRRKRVAGVLFPVGIAAWVTALATHAGSDTYYLPYTDLFVFPSARHLHTVERHSSQTTGVEARSPLVAGANSMNSQLELI